MKYILKFWLTSVHHSTINFECYWKIKVSYFLLLYLFYTSEFILFIFNEEINVGDFIPVEIYQLMTINQFKTVTSSLNYIFANSVLKYRCVCVYCPCMLLMSIFEIDRPLFSAGLNQVSPVYTKYTWWKSDVFQSPL